MIEASALLDAELQRPAGTNQHAPRTEGFDNVQDLSAPTGNTRQAALRRLLSEVTP